MRQHRIWWLIPAALVLGACASAEPPTVVQPPIVLGGYLKDAPLDEACSNLIGQAAVRDAQREFKLAGMLNTNTYPKPGASQVRPMLEMPLVPFGSRLAGKPVPQMDGTARSLYVNCETRQAYVSKRGGVIDITYWYGPFGL